MKRRKKSERVKAKERAWKMFSLYVRKSNEKNGYIECYTCGKRKKLKEMSAGHAIGGRNNAVLFDIRIVKPQCVGCNKFGGGQYQIFAYKLIKELGMGVYEKILFNSHKAVKYTIFDFEDIYEKYKKLLEAL